jgi:hypothetical protein
MIPAVRNWVGIVVALYFGALALLAFPLGFLMRVGNARDWMAYLPWAWGVAAVFAAGQATLLIVPANLARERPVGRRKLLVPVITTGLLLSLLMLAGVGSLILACTGEEVDKTFRADLIPLIPLPFLWCVWGWFFWAYFKTRDPETLMARLMKGMLRGSILELLVAVPSHVIVRNRGDCCAPAVTFMGIVTGLSLMLMSFGPGVLFLFAKRFKELRRAQATAEEP